MGLVRDSIAEQRRTNALPAEKEVWSSGSLLVRNLRRCSWRSAFLERVTVLVIPGGVWQSPNSGARYPLEWQISIPSLELELSEQTSLKNQELFSKDQTFPSYWEGAVTYTGHIHATTRERSRISGDDWLWKAAATRPEMNHARASVMLSLSLLPCRRPRNPESSDAMNAARPRRVPVHSAM